MNNLGNAGGGNGGSGNSGNPEGIERGSCLLRYASQNSLDESSQKHIQRPNGKDRQTGQYQNDQHTRRAFESMNDMRKQSQLCDVTLVADDIEIPAHKMVLASCSPYFYAMFTGFEESRQERITLQGVDHRALELLIEYVYTSTVEVNEENVQVLLTAANLLQLTDVREACCDYLQTQLDASNCLGIREFADMHACVDLLGYAETYIEQHFNEVIQFDEFLNLSHEQVINLICNDRISVPCEEKVYECVISWIRYDPTMREQYTAALMENVRLPFLSKEYLTQRVDKEPLLEGNIKCKDLIIEALTYHLLPNDTKSIRTIPRKAVGLPKILLVIGGQAPKAIRSVECYDLREEKWYQAAEMPNRRCRAGLCVLGDKVYAVGGFNGSLRVRTVDVYDPATNQWSDFYNMEARRSTLGVAVLNGCIFAVGGFDGTTGLSSAEMYDPKAEAWRFISSMSTRRSSVGVGVVNGLLYAVGGYDGFSRQCLSSVERYNPETDTWSPVADMSARRSGAGVGVLNNILYAVGGHDGPMVRRSVEAYDTETNQWRSVADMAFCRRNAGVVAHCGMLYVVGGDDGTSNLASVEVYSPESDTWRPLPASMTIGRSYAGVCMIDKPIQTASNANGVVDDENSQAEGTVEGAVGYARPESNSANNNNNNNNANHPHYENLYESIEHYNNNNSNQNNNNAAVLVANAPAEEHHQQPAQAQPQPLQSHSEPPPRPPNAPLNQPNLANNNNQSNNLNASSQPRVSYQRNDLYDRAQQHPGPAYDVPRSVRAGLGIRRNFHIDLGSSPPSGSAVNRSAFHSSRYGSSSVAPASYSTGGSAGGSLLYGSNRQRSLDDTVEAANFYANLNYHQPTANLPMRYENLYEQIRDEPIYRNTGPGAQVYGRLNVIGHGIGRIERHLSSSCGNIDHYNLGGHYAVLGHSHYGTVGHIRLNAAASGPAGVAASAAANCGGGIAAASGPAAVGQKDPNNVKTSASSFFSCLHGENSQSMTNIPRGSSMAPPSGANGSSLAKARETRSSSAGPSPAAAATAALLATGSFTPPPVPNEAAASSSSSSANTAKQTGAIPKTKTPAASKNGNGSSPNAPTAAGSSLAEKSSLSLRNALTKTKAFTGSQSDDEKASKAATSSPPPDQANGSTLNRISKSSLQWLLMNKWLPLWIGQGPDCKVIDFNFMFSRDCVGCDAASAASQMYGSPRLGCMPLAQDVVRFNARAEMHRETDRRRDLNGRPMHSTLCRLRETQQAASNRREPAGGRQLYEDPSYENVRVQWQNGFEFCRSRESDYNYAQQQPQQPQAAAPQQRPQLQRARSESPKFNTAQQRRATMGSSRKYSDPFRKYELNSENNTFKPKLVRMESTESSGSGGAGEFAKGEKSAVATPPLEVDELELEAEGAVGGRDLAAASPGPSVQRTPSAAECDAVVVGQAAALPPATDNETEQKIAANNNNNEQTED